MTKVSSEQSGGLREDDGLSTIEIVILAPVMLLFILVLVAFGQLVDGRGAVDGAARDAARAGSLAHGTEANAMAAARGAAGPDLSGTCGGGVQVRHADGEFKAGGIFTVEVTCQVRGLAMLGLDVGKTITGRASSPIDPYKRIEP